MVKTLDGIRKMLTEMPMPGLKVPPHEAVKYSRNKRWLPIEQMAFFMCEVSKFIGIFKEEFEPGMVSRIEDIDDAAKTINKQKFSGIQLGIFKFEPDKSFEGGIQVWASLGTILDDRLK